MEILEFEHDMVIARKNDKVKCWYLIQQGSVLQKMEFSEIRLEKNSIIGFLERDIYLCDYIAIEDTSLVALNCETSENLKRTLSGKEKIRNIFLRAAVLQRHNLLKLYTELFEKTNEFRTLVENLYYDYKLFCGKYKIETQNFPKMDLFKPLVMQHKAENWEVHNSISIVRKYMQEYLQLMEKDDSLTVGVIMEAAAQMRRFTLGISEMESYLSYNKDILLSENELDLYKLYFDLSIEVYAKKYDIEPITEAIGRITQSAEKFQIYNSRLIRRRVKEYEEYDYSGGGKNALTADGAVKRMEMDVFAEDCLSHILEYAGYQNSEIDELSDMIKGYFHLPDLSSTDKETYALRKKITADFYEIYYKVFIKAMEDESTLTPILEMFLNFGFMDASFIGEDRVRELYDLCAHLDICHSRHVYTIYEWLKQIYKGKKETSKNEYDANYPAVLAEQYREKSITKEELEKRLKDPKLRVEFEIKNMFSMINKLTYGRISTFCPILNGSDMINSIDKMLVTAEKLETAMNEVRMIDYSIFYREVPFSDKDHGIANDRVVKEILPDIILMPNVGTKAMMWQETATTKTDTPGRFMFPIFTSVDLSDLMLVAMGRFRWEICRKIEGMRWNDLREKSLTAEYCNYLQFYKKNSELSPDAKEKVKNTMQNVKNNYREVFVKDYINWIKFEARGSYRLNKVARDILVRYCPFNKSIRNELRNNPFYQLSMTRFETELTRKQQHYAGVLVKYEKAGGKFMKDLQETALYYDM
ncbi:MAG: cyclic nucleotide-binding domain-containing protein [Lachnospiraceae bacterium]|nr:cyclic nucleotide-binding domain-containing protein [Lachnospiraceae bacterium]